MLTPSPRSGCPRATGRPAQLAEPDAGVGGGVAHHVRQRLGPVGVEHDDVVVAHPQEGAAPGRLLQERRPRRPPAPAGGPAPARRSWSIGRVTATRPSRSTITASQVRAMSSSTCDDISTRDAELDDSRRTSCSISSRPAGSRPLVGSSRITSSRRVDDRLGQVGALPHADRERADQARALLLQADVEQHLGGAQHRRPGGAGRAARPGARRSPRAVMPSGRQSCSGM